MSDKRPNRLKRSAYCGWPRLAIHIPDSSPSWRIAGSGNGVANIEFTHSRDSISIDAEETAFARGWMDEKRDVTRRVMLDLDRQAAFALHAFLGEFLANEPRK